MLQFHMDSQLRHIILTPIQPVPVLTPPIYVFPYDVGGA